MKRTILSITLCLLFTALTFAGTGAVAGKISDMNNQESIGYASVYLLIDNEIAYSTVTDEFGYYMINDVPEGYYTFEVSYAGYIKEKIKNLPIKEKVNLNFNIVLEKVPILRIPHSSNYSL